MSDSNDRYRQMYEENRSEIHEDAKAILKQIVEFQRKYPYTQFYVEYFGGTRSKEGHDFMTPFAEIGASGQGEKVYIEEEIIYKHSKYGSSS